MPTNRLIDKEKVAIYASTLLDGAYGLGGQDAVLEARGQLEHVVKFMRTNIGLSEAMGDPSYSSEQRRALILNTFLELGFNPVLIEVLAVMAERGDFDLVPRLWSSFGDLLESKLDISVVDVTTVVPLDDYLRQVITRKAETDMGTRVVLREHIDKSLLGGIVMSAGGKRIDASVLSQLENARNVLKLSTDGGEG